MPWLDQGESMSLRGYPQMPHCICFSTKPQSLRDVFHQDMARCIYGRIFRHGKRLFWAKSGRIFRHSIAQRLGFPTPYVGFSCQGMSGFPTGLLFLPLHKILCSRRPVQRFLCQSISRGLSDTLRPQTMPARYLDKTVLDQGREIPRHCIAPDIQRLGRVTVT